MRSPKKDRKRDKKEKKKKKHRREHYGDDDREDRAWTVHHRVTVDEHLGEKSTRSKADLTNSSPPKEIRRESTKLDAKYQSFLDKI